MMALLGHVLYQFIEQIKKIMMAVAVEVKKNLQVQDLSRWQSKRSVQKQTSALAWILFEVFNMVDNFRKSRIDFFPTLAE